jgi:CubicO group peptidase (beta-lactamase class C family)
MPKWRIIFLAVCLSTCSVDRAVPTSAHAEPTSSPSTAPLTTDDWETASPADVGVNAAQLDRLNDRLIDGTYHNIHSVLIAKDGKLIFERYFAGTDEAGHLQHYDRDTLHDIASATKSVNSILVGIAVDQKLIKGVDQKISSFFPDYADLFADNGRNSIRLSDALSMTAGLSWDEWTFPYTDSRNDHVAMNASADPVRYVLSRPMSDPPGTKFVYNSGVAIVVGEIIHKASKVRADEFAKRNLFAPLGIEKWYWMKYPNGVVQTGGGLWMRPRDMAKIGQLCLNGGRWHGRQIVSAAWIAESTRQHAPDRDYGFGWWLGALSAGDHKVNAYGAQGRGGQFIIVLPELKMVAVFTGWNEGAQGEQAYDMLQRYVLPAAINRP